jgi:ketosteroid isomerase-like protein
MATTANTERYDGAVKQYFSLIGDLREGREGAVERLVDMWDADGVFEFCGAHPVTARFQGRNAIHALYRNRFNANGMPLKLSAEGKAADAALGTVATDVNRLKVTEDRAVAAWTTTIGTKDARGFQVAGSHAFTFKDGKIASLKVVVSPKAETSKNLRLEGLAVDDIGRLSLAAWAVV